MAVPNSEPDMTEPPMPSGPMPPMDDAPMGDMPEDGGQEPPMDDAPMDAPEGGNQEIDDIFGKLDTEKQAAVIKYAKSMVNNQPEDGGQEPPMGDPNGMPMESKSYFGKLVNEIVNNILNNEEDEDDETERPDTKIRNKKVTKGNPFIAK